MYTRYQFLWPVVHSRPPISMNCRYILSGIFYRNNNRASRVFCVLCNILAWQLMVPVLYSILVAFSPTFYCLPNPLFLYGSMVLLSTLVLSSYNVLQCLLGYGWWLCMVIDVSVQYNGGFLPDIILLTITTIGEPA